MDKTSVEEAIECFKIESYRTSSKTARSVLDYVIEKLEREYVEKNKQEINKAYINGKNYKINVNK